jgi:hypothetical protein
MNNPAAPKILLFVLMLLLSACAPATLPPATQTAPAQPTNPPAPTSTLAPTLAPAPTATITAPPAPELSFKPAVYQDQQAAVELDYPEGWTVHPRQVVGSRGSQAQIFSPGASAEKVEPGASRLGLTIYQWDPKKELDAFAAHRKEAWQASGFTVTLDKIWALTDGRKVMSYIIQTPDKLVTYFLLTTAGEDYLEFTGEGNLPLVREIASTLRPAKP